MKYIILYHTSSKNSSTSLFYARRKKQQILKTNPTVPFRVAFSLRIYSHKITYISLLLFLLYFDIIVIMGSVRLYLKQYDSLHFLYRGFNMGEFGIALSNVSLTLAYVILGFCLCKGKKAVANHLPTMSSVLIYLGSPFLVMSSFLKLEYSPQILGKMGLFFLAAMVLQGAFMALLYFILHKKMQDFRYRICTMASVMGNAGFFGLPIVKALLPDHPEVLCYACMYIVSMNLMAFTMGAYLVTGQRKYMTLKAAIINPTMIGLLISLPLFAFEVFPLIASHVPAAVTGIEAMASLTTPICMIILGIRLATVDLKLLFSRGMVYFACALKLLVFPLFVYAISLLFPLDEAFRGALFILSGTPCASLVLNLTEIHETETGLAANCVLVSTLLCVLTIPLLALLL